MPVRRVRMVAALAAALVVIGVAAPVGGASGLQGKTSAEVLSAALSAARAAGSVHIVQTGTIGSDAATAVLDQNKVEGKEVDSGARGHGTILVIGGVGYVKGDVPYLTNFGFTSADAARDSGKWISFHKGQPGYASVVADETLAGTLVDASPAAPLSSPRATTLDGRAVIRIDGQISKRVASSGAAGTVTTYVSAKAPYLPVEAVDHVKEPNGGPTITFTTHLSRWRESVSVSAPTKSTPITKAIS